MIGSSFDPTFCNIFVCGPLQLMFNWYFKYFFPSLFFSEVQWTVIPNVKSSKYLIAMRKILLLDFFSYTCHHFANHLRFFEKWSRDISRDLETQNFYFILLRTMMSTLFVQNFDSAHYPLCRS